MEYTVRFSFILDWIIEQFPKPLPFHQQLSSFVTHYRVHSKQTEEKKYQIRKKVSTETILIWTKSVRCWWYITTSTRLLNKCEILENFNGWNRYTITATNRVVLCRIESMSHRTFSLSLPHTLTHSLPLTFSTCVYASKTFILLILLTARKLNNATLSK